MGKRKRHDHLARPSRERGKQLSSRVYSLHEPQGQPSVEIVFIHGLQRKSENAYKEAYWTTWLARDGCEDNCWPATWLAAKFPNARILSISYDANLAVKSSTSGSMDLYPLGESLAQEMVFEGVNVGQNGCPVVYACHCLGGLVAKQIVVMAYAKCKGDGRFDKLFRNTKGFVFYATPHEGSSNMFTIPEIQVIGRLNGSFAAVEKEFNHEWKTYVVDKSHFDVCRPESSTSSSFLHLTTCIEEIEAEHEVRRAKILEVADYVVPVDTKLRELREKLKLYPVVGLIGMGGIGKTTLSKIYFNAEKEQYDKCCYLEDVKSHGSTVVCFKELLRQLFDEKWNENGHADGYILKIEGCIRRKKVLVVIDDGTADILREMKLLDAFESGSSGSKAVITCRNGAILSDYISKEQKIEVDGLDHDAAEKLFFQYAHHEMVGEEKPHFQEHGEKIVEACAGLPLSIVVIGQYLRKQRHRGFEERIELWKEALQKLKDADSVGGGCNDDEKLWKKLRISYDDLAPKEKGFFLDFACVLCDAEVKEKWALARIWDSLAGVLTLIDCSLIKAVCVTDPRNGRKREELVLHDQLRDMGRMVAGEVDFRRTRMWKESQVQELFEDTEGSREDLLEGLSIVGVEKLRGNGSGEKGKGFQNLRLLNLSSERDVMEYVLKQCAVKPRNIRFVRVLEHAFGADDIRGIFEKFNGLRVLHMVHCRTTDLDDNHLIPWSLGPSTIALAEFRELNLRGCSGLKGVQVVIGKLVNLQVLVLGGCDLDTLPSSVGNLAQLLELDLEGCHNLCRLPTTLGKLKLLKLLNLRDCLSLKKIPSEVGQLTKLECLDVTGSFKLRTICEFDAKMDHLRYLGLRECGSLEGLSSLGNLHQLDVLDLSKCRKLRRLSECLGGMTQLQRLNLTECSKLERLPNSFGGLTQLQRLHLSICSKLQRLPESLGGLTRLQQLDSSRCPKLECLPESLGGLTRLQQLDLSRCPKLECLPESLGGLTRLQQLDLSWCSKLECLPESLGGLTQLEVLDLSWCFKLKCLPESLGGLTQLQELNLSKCCKLECLQESLGGLTQLVLLDLSRCFKLKHLPESLVGLTRLQRLNLTECSKLECLPNCLGGLTQLQQLHLSLCSKLKRLPKSLGGLTQLQELNLSKCCKLECLWESLGGLTQLVLLDLCKCSKLECLPNCLGELTQLQQLYLSWCSKLKCLPESLGGLTQLERLDLSNCSKLEFLPNSLGGLTQLKRLDLSNCSKLECLPESLGGLTQLQMLDLRSCSKLERLPESIIALTRLLRLNLLGLREFVVE